MSTPSQPPLLGQQQPPDSHSPPSQLIHPPTTLLPASTIPLSTSSPPLPTLAVPSSVLNLYLGVGATLLTIGVAFGIRLGNRQAAQLERDNPPPTTTARTKQPPPITPQQRKAAFRATIGALGLGTLLCAGFGGVLVYGMGRYWGVTDTKEFAVRMDSVVADQRRKWLGSMVSQHVIPHIDMHSGSGVMRDCDLLFCRADVPSHGQSTTNIPSRLTMQPHPSLPSNLILPTSN